MIRTSLLLVCLLIAFATCAYAQSVTMAWSANPEPNLAGYNIYRSEQSGTFPSTPLNGATLYQSTSFTDATAQYSRTYYYVVTAVTTTGVQSAYSNPVQTTVGPAPISSTPTTTSTPTNTTTSSSSSGRLVGHWKFEEASGSSALDSSLSGITGTLVNGPTRTTGKIGNALSFNGTQYVDLGNPAALQLTGAMTVSAWVNVSNLNNGRIVAKSGGGGLNGWSLNVEKYNAFEFSIAADSKTEVYVDTVTPVPLQTWVHVAGVYQPGTAIRIYVNGVLNNSKTSGIPAAQFNPAINARIGTRPSGPTGSCGTTCSLIGRIDEVQVYNRALSASEIQAVATGTSLLSTDEPFLAFESGVAPDEVQTTLSNTVQVPLSDERARAAGLSLVRYLRDGQLTSEAVFPSSRLISSGRMYAALQDSVNTGLAISNPHGEPVTMSFYFTDEAGTTLHSGSVLIESYGQHIGSLSDSPFLTASDFLPSSARTFTFSTSLPIGVVAARTFTNERSESLVAPLPIAQLDSLERYPNTFPYYADGEGWQSDIQLVNPADAPISGVVRFFSNVNGSEFDVPYEIAPRSAISLRAPWLSAGAGWVQVNPQVEMPVPLGSLILSFIAEGKTLSQTSIDATAEAASFFVYTETSQGDQAGSVQTALIINNPSSGPVQLDFELFDLNGAATGRRGSLQVDGRTSTKLFVDQLTETKSMPFRGFLRIEGAPIVAAGLRHTVNHRGDPLTNAIPVFTEATLTSSEPVFSFFTSGNDYATEFIDFSSLGAVSAR